METSALVEAAESDGKLDPPSLYISLTPPRVVYERLPAVAGVEQAADRTAPQDPNGRGAEFLPPREDVNSPDMYIPLMAFVTYILLSTLIAGLNGRFDPTLLGITTTNASLIILLELLLLWLGKYLLNIQSESQIYDLVAYSGYKFVGVIVTVAVGAALSGGGGKAGGWIGWAVFAYAFNANAFFLVCTSPHSPSLHTHTPSHIWEALPTDLPHPTAEESQIRPPPLRLLPRDSRRRYANHRPRSEITKDAVSVRVQLCGAIRFHALVEQCGCWRH